jgi:enterochelin esterase-like enzyme
VPHASQVPITGPWLCAALAGLAVVAVVLVPWRWDAWRRRRLGRSVTVLIAVGAVVLACAGWVNRLGSFFPTLGAVIGTSSDPADGTDVEAGDEGQRLASVRGIRVSRARDGHGTTAHLVLTGAHSRLKRDVDVYFPPGYDDPNPAVRFPVVEWFPGFPGEPREVASLFRLPTLLDDAIDHERMPPTVVVIPDINGEPRLSHDEECVDAVGGAADDTFLSDDVRSWTLARLRVRTDRAGWALAGWSSGGYCAMNLALRHPTWYGTAASQSGYDATPLDPVTRDLFAGREDLRRANDVSQLLRAHPIPLDLLVTNGVAEQDEAAAAGRIGDAAAAPVDLTRIVFPGGGHNTDAVQAQLPTIIAWLGERLPAPTAPFDRALGDRDDHPGVLPWSPPFPGPSAPPSP